MDVRTNHQVTYDYPLSAQLQKPLTVATVLAGLFVLAMGLRRVDFSLEGRRTVTVKKV